MGALTEIYVEPAIAANSGTGVIGDPYGDCQYALDTTARDTTNGNRFNIKAGTAEILAAALSLTTYGTPTSAAPLWFRGYTSAAGDGGIGKIDGNAGGFSTFAGSAHVWFQDMELFNTGAADVVQIGLENAGLIHCKIHGTTGIAIDETAAGNSGNIIGCYIYDFGTIGIRLSQGNIHANYIVLTTADNDAIVTQSVAGGSAMALNITRNIISIQGVNAEGIRLASGRTFFIANNSVYTTFAGTQRGILANGQGVCINNLVEGFSGVGGVGILTSTGDVAMVANNSVYNNTAAFSFTTDVFSQANNNTLGASPFAKSGSDTFDNRFTFFAPVDTGTVHGGSYYAGSF
jgi:hypothetical protein